MLSQNGLIREEVEAVLRDHESEIEVRSLGSLGSLVTLYESSCFDGGCG